MKRALHPNTPYGKGSTGFHTAVPPQASDSGSGGVPHRLTTPPLRKPAVLATLQPEPSQGTPGTAICAVINHPGPVLPRQQHGDSGVESSLADRWRALVKRVKTKVKQWQAQIRRYYLAHMRKHVALTTKLTFRFVRLIAITVRVSRLMWFRRPALPYGAMNRFEHDRRFALFRRRAVSYASGGQRVITIRRPPLQRVEAGVRSTDTRLTNVLNKKTNNMKKTIKTGLSAMMAFAFMFATSLSVVAQENTAISTDKMEAESVKAKVLASAVQKLSAALAQAKITDDVSANVVMKEPKEITVKTERSGIWYLYNHAAGPYDPNNPTRYDKMGPTEEPTCVEGTTLCAVFLPDNEGEQTPDPDDLASIQNDIESSQPDPSLVRKFTP